MLLNFHQISDEAGMNQGEGMSESSSLRDDLFML